MLKLVLIGCGRQGLLHLKCYSKIKDVFDIRVVGVVDCNPQRANSFKQLLSKLGFKSDDVIFRNNLMSISNELNLSETIVDIVTTNSTHHENARVASEKGAQGIIIEKPIADTLDHAQYINTLDCPIYVVENYLFSAITQFAKDYIHQNHLDPCFAKTEFSKDRRLDSSNGRGLLDDYIPHVFTIEIPHQLALVSYLLGFPQTIYDAWCHDMILPDGRISDHGEGAITLDHGNGITSYNFSCLQGYRHLAIAYRTVRVYCKDNTKIFCYYPTTVDLDGSVLIYKREELVEKKVFIDDSLTETLRYILSCFKEKRAHFNNAQFGYNLMEVIDKSKKFASEYR